TFGVEFGGKIVDSDERSATTCWPVAEQFTSISPGWMTSSPIVDTRPLPPDATSPQSTWLLLRMYCCPPFVTSEPSVPPQQNPFARSSDGLPEVPSWIGGVCRAVWLTPPPPPFIATILPETSSTTGTPSIVAGSRP